MTDLIAAVACILLIVEGIGGRNDHWGEFIAALGAGGIVLVALL